MQLHHEYIVGLVDGEGSFTFRINANPTRRNKVEFRFYLKLQAEDKPILDSLKEYFKCGNVYIQKDKRLNHSLCYRYEVGSYKHLSESIIPFFKKFQPKFPSKLRDFNLFCDAMSLVEQGDHLKLEGIKLLKSIKDKMH